MKLLLIITLSLLSFHVLAFKTSSLSTHFTLSADGTTCTVTAPSSYTITDANAGPGGHLPNHRAVGVELCRYLGKLPPSGGNKTSGSFWHYPGDDATANCAYRSTGVASGSWTCQSSANYANAK